MANAAPLRFAVPRRLLAAVLLSSLAGGSLAAAPPPPAERQQPPAFSENVLVREVEVSVQIPDDLSVFVVRRLKPEDFRVQRDGQTESVTRVEPAWHGKGSEPWTIVVYVDRVLSRQGNTAAALAALTRRVGRLTELGRVDVVVADPEPRALRTAERDPKALAAALGEITPRLDATGAASSPDPESVRRQLDRLLVWLATERTVGPRLLWLVADRLPLSLEALTALGEKPASGLERGLPKTGGDVAEAEALVNTARCLAAYGWVTLAGPLGQPEQGPIGPDLSDYERFRRDIWKENPVFVPILRTGGRWVWEQPAPNRLTTNALVATLDPQLAALRRLALSTSGWLVPAESDVDPVLDALYQRFRVWYRAADPLDGRLHDLRVTLVKGNQELRAPRWVRSSTPEAVTAARLLHALDRGEPGGSLPLRIGLAPAGAAGDLELQIDVAAGSGEAGSPSPLRVSWAVATDRGVVLAHRVLEQPVDLRASGVSLRQKLRVQGAVRRVAALVESLADESWGVGLASPAPPAP